jgi:predicted phage terminase large subunit-like protein
MIATPFHQDDMMGRAQRVQNDWTVLRLAAICDDPENDPLGRKEGEPLWADDNYGFGQRLLEIRAAAEREGRMRDFYAQYMGLPQPPEGNLFKPDRMPTLDTLPSPPIEIIRAWDLASTARGDYTDGMKLAHCYDQTYNSIYVILDNQRIRGAPEEVRHLVKTVAEHDGFGVKIAMPQDPGQAGVDQIVSYTQMLAGYPLISERMSGNKETRAYAAAATANIGRIGMLRADWNAALREELAAFPSGQHDDQVDALSLGFNLMTPSNLQEWLRL